FVLVQPVIGSGQTHHALADRQEAWLDALRSTDGMPASVEEEGAGPGGKPVGHKCCIVTEQVTPLEAGALEEIDLRHDEIAERNIAAVVADAVEDKTAKRAFLTAERDVRLALRAAFGRRFAGGLVAGETDLLLERAMHQAGGAEIEHNAVGLDDARMFVGIDGSQTPTDHLDHGRLV